VAPTLKPPRSPDRKLSRQPLSLKARAVNLLSRREHSRTELNRKLRPHTEDPAELEEVINDLERQGFFNEERFATVFARSKGAKFGVMRVKQELAQHKLAPELAQKVLSDLKVTELQRAREVWLRRFLNPPVSIEEKLKQQRFLMQRGFASETIQKLFRHPNDD
jgi:regulatory protein